ncbi:MAG: segregation and condensation protein A [Pseudomonadota bacterium]
MTDREPSKEERILRVMKRVLTDVAKDTYTKPGYRHPLSEQTIDGIRQCLALITAREGELQAEAGRSSKLRPRFIDEPQTSVVVPLKMPEPKPEDSE